MPPTGTGVVAANAGKNSGIKSNSKDVIKKKIPAESENTRSHIPIPSLSDRLHSPIPYESEEIDPANGEVVRNTPRYHWHFRYDYCATDVVQFPNVEYTLCEVPPYTARINPLECGRRCQLIGDDHQTVYSPLNYASAKGNMCIKGGSWYFEIDVISPNVRIGIARREASCNAPVGYNAYGYAVQSKNGLACHCGRTREFMEPFGAGDTIGFHVYIPIDSRIKQFRRNRAPVKFSDQLWLESFDYVKSKTVDEYESTRTLPEPKSDEVIPGSFCKVYKNGVLAGTLAEPLRDFRPPHSELSASLQLSSMDDGLLGYFPMISCHGGGSARLNCGPEFKHAIPESALGLHERYDEQVADDFTMNVMEEIFNEELNIRFGKPKRQVGLQECKVNTVFTPDPVFSL